MTQKSTTPPAEETSQPAAEQSAESTTPEQGPEVQELHLMLEDARNKADEHWNQLLRLQAEMENLRRRSERDVESAHKFALEKFAAALLPVKDSLEMGLAATSGAEEEAVMRFKEGSELTLKMLGDVLEKFGIVEVDPQGQPFNPELHQAMTMQPSADHPANTVLTVMQKGYTLNERLLRPAMVVVSKEA